METAERSDLMRLYTLNLTNSCISILARVAYFHIRKFVGNVISISTMESSLRMVCG